MTRSLWRGVLFGVLWTMGLAVTVAWAQPEQTKLERLRIAGGRIAYIADAGLDHRRTEEDARFGRLARAAYARGRGARASDTRRGKAPGIARELRVLAGCGWHTVRRACPQGLVMGAHSAGRVVEALRPR